MLIRLTYGKSVLISVAATLQHEQEKKENEIGRKGDWKSGG